MKKYTTIICRMKLVTSPCLISTDPKGAHCVCVCVKLKLCFNCCMLGAHGTTLPPDGPSVCVPVATEAGNEC